MKKFKITDIILVAIFLIGLSLLLYPTVSEYWNSFHQSRAISSYVERVALLGEEEYKEIWEEARAYNENLYRKGINYHLSEEEKKEYNGLLNIEANGIMGYINIPAIDCSLPIYHGTDEAILQVAIGHLEWSSLPVGGVNSHCVISGHRGLPSARLFTDLDQLAEGDIFIMQVLDEVFTYEIDQIRIVLPHELKELEIVEGEDLCTLVTCTPYGVNTHRLLVRGHRVEDRDYESVRVSADAIQVEPVFVAPIVAAPILFVLFIWLLFYHKKPKKEKGKK